MNRFYQKLAVLFWGLPIFLGYILILSFPWTTGADWQLHMSMGALLAKFGDWSFLPEGVYCLQPFTSYHLFHYLVAFFYKLVGPHWVSRAVLLFIYTLFLFSGWLFLKANKSDWRGLALLSIIFFGYPYQKGFGPFLFGLPFFFFSLAAVLYWIETGEKKWGIVFSITLIATALIHVAVFAITGVVIAGYWLLKWVWDSRWRWRIVSASVPSLVIGGYYLYITNKRLHEMILFWKKFEEKYPFVIRDQSTPSFVEKLLNLPEITLFYEDAQFPLLSNLSFFLFSLFLILLVAVSLRILKKYSSNLYRDSLKTSFVTLFPLAAYLFLPKLLLDVNFVYERFGIFVFISLIASIPSLSFLSKEKLINLKLYKWRRLSFILANLAVVTIFSIQFLLHVDYWVGLRGLFPLMKKIPQNSRVLGVLLAYKASPGIVQTYRGGEVQSSFTFYRHMPVVDCDPYRQLNTWVYTISPSLFVPENPPKWDYIIFYLGASNAELRRKFPWAFSKKSPYCPLYQAGRWVLFVPRDKCRGKGSSTRPASR